ncbi:T9SS type A sorting domain-containing protein [bacterium]|nr:T9SS type A sorting domain-containing protein [bacterium]
MKNFLLILMFFAMVVSQSMAQDTIWVNTLSFDDITKRRGEFVLPPRDEYRKILMYYTLKCDPKTTQDKYNCGEWDYLTYNYLYDHSATFDSTYQSGVNFMFQGRTPDVFPYSEKPLFDKIAHHYEILQINDTVNYEKYQAGMGTDTLHQAIATTGRHNVSQVYYTAAELNALGLTPGPITGIKLNVLKGASVDEFTIGILSVANLDSLTWQNRQSGFTTVYQAPITLSAGWQGITFNNPLMWNGVEDIVFQFEAKQQKGGQPLLLEGTSTTTKMGFSKSAYGQTLDLNGAGAYVNFNKGLQVDGDKPRTVEMWAYTRAFNDGGLFQAGQTGTTLQDWSLRTTTTDDKWRIQLWGQDQDKALDGSKGAWHHYALVYDGSATTLYYDGEYQAYKNASVNTPDHEFWLGRWNGSYFDGMVDNVRVWETAISKKNLKEWMSKPATADHPAYDKLLGDYNFDNDSSLYVSNAVSPKFKGLMQNSAFTKKLSVYDDFNQAQNFNSRPNIIFERGTYNSHTTNIDFVEKVERRPVMVYVYGNEANGRIIDDNARKHPSLITDTLVVWQSNLYTYTFDDSGKKLDSAYVKADKQLQKEVKEWYSPTVRYEIGRYITPYGINLSLGKNGFTWVYDVTEYAPLLHDTIDFSAGNMQELIDIKLAFIKGKPTHEVKRIDRIWNHGSYSYKALDNDDQLKARKVDLLSDAETFVVRTRLTGHGERSNDGSYPHCCEWKDNTHYLFVDGKQVADWHVWREDCDLNPVFPQGGNWVGAREGWCPGDVVNNYDFNITSNITGNATTIDYGITAVPANNQGMGNGNYIVAMQLFQYGAPNFSTDASIELVKRPTNWGYYKRINPACEAPLIVVKNTGKNAITSLKISYGVSGGTKKTYSWTGNLAFLETTEIELPIDGSYFWVGNGDDIFTATIDEVNGSADENSANNSYNTHFQVPDLLDKKPIVVQLKTNSYPEANRYEIRDATGKVVYTAGNFAANTIYRDTVSLDYGCYVLEFFDEGYGLDYWATPDQGSGSLMVRYDGAGLIKNFNPDFGERIYWPFAVGSVSSIAEGEYKPSLEVYPNPAKGNMYVDLSHIVGKYRLELLNSTGQVVYAEESLGTGLNKHQLQVQTAGVYFVRVSTADKILSAKVVVE